MQLDYRSSLLLKELLLSPGIKVNKLSDKLHLTRSQINYSLEKINDWLVYHHYPTIKNDRDVGIKVDEIVKERFPELITKTSIAVYIPSANERTHFILILLLSRQEELSLFHLSDALKVSRNTILNDMKKLEEGLEEYQLTLQYTRQDGYYISGDEFNKRKLLIDIIPRILSILNGFDWLINLTNINKQEIEDLRLKYERVEKLLNITFTDEKLDVLPITFLLLLRRIREGKKLKSSPRYHDLLRTKEYTAVQELLPEDETLDQSERLFITLQLLATSVFRYESENNKNNLLKESIKESLMKFEKLACVTFQEFHELLNKIYQHMVPASYRIKYKLELHNPLIEEIKMEYGHIHHFVEASVTPLELYLQEKISDDELGYITILIISWLQEHGNEIRKAPRAVVICPNGISVSKLLLETLKDMFPQIYFIESMSARDFKNYKMSYDVIFSTVLFPTDKKLFLVKPFITELEKSNLIMRVNQEIFGITSSEINLSNLLDIIKNYATIKDEELLVKDIRKFFDQTSNLKTSKYENLSMPTLRDLFNEERITFKESVSSWEEAVRCAADPLINSGVIQPSYVDAIFNLIEEFGHYMFLTPGVAIPHARTEDGVNQLSMSLLRLRNPIDFGPGVAIKFVIIVAAIDKKTHMKALSQLRKLLSAKDKFVELEKATNKSEFLHLLENPN